MDHPPFFRPIEDLNPTNHKMKKQKRSLRCASSTSAINSLDDGCLMHIFAFLDPIPDRYNTALVCHRWHYLACHPRLWLRVEQAVKCSTEPGVFQSLEAAVSAARLVNFFYHLHNFLGELIEISTGQHVFVGRPGDTILISACEDHLACNVQIKKPLCLIGGGDLPDDTILTCSRGSDSAIEFFSTCKVANLTVRAELGCCFLHRQGRLTIDGCLLQCEDNPLDYLSCAIISTASNFGTITSETAKENQYNDCVMVSETRIEGGTNAIVTRGTLTLQHVRAIYARTAVFFWFEVGAQ